MEELKGGLQEMVDLNARVGYHRLRDLFLREDFVTFSLEISFLLCY